MPAMLPEQRRVSRGAAPCCLVAMLVAFTGGCASRVAHSDRLTLAVHVRPSDGGRRFDVTVRNGGREPYFVFLGPLPTDGVPFLSYAGSGKCVLLQGMCRKPDDVREYFPYMYGVVRELRAGTSLRYDFEIEDETAESYPYDRLVGESPEEGPRVLLGDVVYKRCSQVMFVQAYWRASDLPPHVREAPEWDSERPATVGADARDVWVVGGASSPFDEPSPAVLNRALVEAAVDQREFYAVTLTDLQRTLSRTIELSEPLLVYTE